MCFSFTKSSAMEDLKQYCAYRINAVNESMEILSGKWKIHILGTLLYSGKMRFMDLQREVVGIGSKMLSKELQDLEINQLLTRTVLKTKPITVEYELTDFGKTLEPIIEAIAKWGMDYRETLFGKKTIGNK